MTRTNFDVWRDGLTPGDVWDTRVGYFHGDPCRHCPAIDLCGNVDGLTCEQTFYRWANAPAKEEK
jgi:hypothetical protein